jgi:multidrug resistance efflux pump
MSAVTLNESPADEAADRFPAHPAKTILLSLLALGLGIAISVTLERLRHDAFNGTYQTKVRSVAAPREARIAEWMIKPGSSVKIGQPLVRLADDRLDDLIAEQQRDVVTLRAELAQVEARVAVELDWRLRDINADVFETKLKSAHFLKQQYVTKLEGLAIQDLLKETDPLATQELESPALRPLVISTRKFDERRTRLLLEQEAALNTQEVAAAQVDLCEERLKQLEKLSAGLAEKIRSSSGIDVARARVEQAEQELKALEARRESLVIHADAVGMVGANQKLAGDVVALNDILVTLIDNEQPFVLAFVPAARLADVSTGRIVTLRFPNGRKGTGRVVDASLPTGHRAAGIALADVQTVPVQIVPEGSLWPTLPIGAAVEVRLK